MRVRGVVRFLAGLVLGGLVAVAPAQARQPGAGAASDGTIEPGDKALLIGINDYVGSDNDLEGSTRDAEDIARLLVGRLGWRDDQIHTLLDGAATGRGIRAAIDGLLVGGTRPGDRVFLFYSGHGYPVLDEDGDEPDEQDEALTGADGDQVTDDEIRASLDKIADRRVTIAIDSCYSGTATRSLDLADNRAAKLWRAGATRGLARAAEKAVGEAADSALVPPGPNRVVWSAVADTEVALIDTETPEPRGVFTRRFVAGIADRLADASGDGRITHAELLDYLRDESAAYCKRHTREGCVTLTPTLEGPEGVMRMDVITGEKVQVPDPVVRPGVRVEIAPSTTLHLKDRVRFKVTSDLPGHLILLDFGSSGNLTQLFPNQYATRLGLSDEVVPGVPVVVPDEGYGFAIEARPPAGRGHVFAVVADRPIGLESIKQSRLDLGPIADPDKFLDALTERLHRTRIDAAGVSAVRFSAARVAYDVRP